MDKNLFQFYRAALSGEITSPLCSEYRAELRKCGDDKEKLMKLALSQQALPFVVSHAYQNKGLTKEYIKENFKDFVNGYTLKDCDEVAGYSYQMYVDWDYDNDLNVTADVTSVMWTVGANLVVPKTLCPTIYISNRSNVHLVCDGFNTVNIKLFDKSHITIEDLDDESEVVVYKYSNEAVVEEGKFCMGKVKEFSKTLRL